MKTMPAGLVDFLESTGAESCYVADLFTIQLNSGQFLYATDGQMPIFYSGQLYDPGVYGHWSVTRISTVLGVGSTCEFEIFASADTVLNPFNASLLEVVQLGLFSAADFTVRRVFMPTYGDVSLGAEIKYSGQISELRKTGRTSATGTATGFTFRLNQNVPSNALQPSCRWVLGSAACGVGLSVFSATSSVKATSTAVTIVPATVLTQPDGYFSQGVITFTSGRNTGLSMGVKQHFGGNLVLSRAMVFPVAPGDAFTVVAGCDHTAPTCNSKFSNVANFGGTPYIPNFEQAL